MWLYLAFTSAALLGLYDSVKKKSLKDNAVIPVLLMFVPRRDAQHNEQGYNAQKKQEAF